MTPIPTSIKYWGNDMAERQQVIDRVRERLIDGSLTKDEARRVLTALPAGEQRTPNAEIGGGSQMTDSYDEDAASRPAQPRPEPSLAAPQPMATDSTMQGAGMTQQAPEPQGRQLEPLNREMSPVSQGLAPMNETITPMSQGLSPLQPMPAKEPDPTEGMDALGVAIYESREEMKEKKASLKPKEDLSIFRDLDRAFMNIPGAPALSEFASAANRSVFDMVDFLGPDTVNAVFELSGSERRMPTARETFGSEGGYMEPGLARDVVQTAGEVTPMAMAFGQLLRSAAQRLPAFVQGESAGRGIVRQLGSSTPRQDAVIGVQTGTGMALGGEAGESIGGDQGRQVGELVGGLAGPAVMSLARPAAVETTKRLFRGDEGGRKNLVSAISDFAKIGTTPTLGQGTGDGFRQGMENLSGRILGGGPIRNAINRTNTAMQKRLADISDDLSTVRGDVEVGRVMQRGISGEDGFVQRFIAKSGDLWSKVDGKIGTNTQSDMANTRRVLGELVRDDSFASVLNNPKLSQLKSVFDDVLGDSGATVPYSDLKALRSSIGQRISGNDLISDVPRAELKRVHAALSDDTRAVAEQAGALTSFTRANNYTRSGHKRLGDFVERVTNKVDLAKVYSAVARGGEGTQSLNAIKRSLKPNEWEAVVSNVVRNLGKSTAGRQDDIGQEFSTSKFLTDWNKLGSSKKVLFSGSEKLNKYSENLDKIASAANRFKEAAQSMENPSGTGQFFANVGLIGGAGGAVASGNLPAFGWIVSGVAANNGAARLMTNPGFVRWLAKSTEVKSFPLHLAGLTSLAKSEGIEKEIEELTGVLLQAPQETSQP